MPSNVVNPTDSGGRSLNSLFDPTNRQLAVPQGGPSSYDANSGTYYSGLVLATPTSSGGHVIIDANTIATYGASITGLVPAGSCTDLFTLTGAANKVIRIMRLIISATTTSATPVTNDVVLLKRSTANSAGTATQPTVVPFDSADAAAAGVVNAYTANPTTGNLVGNLFVQKLTPTLATFTATDFPSQVPLIFQFGVTDSKPVVLRSASEVFAVNLNAGTVTATASWAISIEWTESLT